MGERVKKEYNMRMNVHNQGKSRKVIKEVGQGRTGHTRGKPPL